MASNLVIVESPAKAKTIQSYLGKDFQVIASFGHVRDLIPKTGAVEPDNDFKMHYSLIEKNKAHTDNLCKAAKKCKFIYLATDQDREGEAISWHIQQMLDEKGLLNNKSYKRIVFNQITKRAVQESLDNARDLSQDLIDAQQARRVLDYLVGFNLSPLLWKKIRTGLSAGRVQSPSLRMIVEREEAINAFEKQEYWSMLATANDDGKTFATKLVHHNQKKLEQFSITNETDAKAVETQLKSLEPTQWAVQNVTEKVRKKEPLPPFITSTLLQESVKKLYMSSSRTMRAAQQLYEGINIDGTQTGLITYMRTDSFHMAPEAIEAIQHYIQTNYGSDSTLSSPRKFKSSSKNDQEAHEAIRPTDVFKTPDQLRSALSDDQFKLYKMIWQRSVASQMQAAAIKQVRMDFHHLSQPDESIFRSTGSTIQKPGFLAVYQEGKEDNETSDTDEVFLPPMTKGQTLTIENIHGKQHFTEPPARYSEASLIKALKDHDIGRPSTYASIISTLQDRDYAKLENKRFHPTDVGITVNRFLTTYFTQYVDYTFTAQLENDLDRIARGETPWKPILKDFWSIFSEKIEDIGKNVDRKTVTEQKIDENCPECKQHLVIKLGRNGNFIGCSGYPDCKYTRNLNPDQPQEPEETIDRDCPKCGHRLVMKVGRYGKFIGCSDYPNCKFIESLNKPEETGVDCPDCKQGHLIKRRARKGNFFYACSAYPKCRYIQSYEPIAKPCHHCDFPITMLKITKRSGEQKVCPKCKEIQTDTDSSS